MPKRKLVTGSRIVLLAAVLAIVDLLIVPGLYWEERIRGERDWRNYEREAQARGVKLRFSDFQPSPVPDAENFASIPIFQAAFQATDNGRKTPDPFALPEFEGHKHPNFASHFKETPVDLAAWQAYFVQTKMLPSAGHDPAADTLAALEPLSAPLSELDEAAKRAYCQFPVHWEQHWMAAMPHGGIVLNAAKLHSLRMAAHLTHGENAAAYGELQEGLRLSYALREEPALILGMVRMMVVEMMAEGAWNGLVRHQWEAPELEKIDADFAKCDLLRDCRFALSSERASSNDVYDMLIRDPRLMVTLIHADMPHRSQRSDIWLYLYPSAWHYRSRLRLNRFYDELLARIEPEKHRWFGDRATPSSPEQIQEMGEKIGHMMFMLQAPVIPEIEARYLVSATTADQARIACALERFRLSRGEYPASLADLESALQLQLPREIVNGEPYHYRKGKNGGFTLYSVGRNLKDDGGVNDPKESASQRLDWVWKCP